MRTVIQRVSQAHVKVESEVTGAIERGLLVFLGVQGDDDDSDIDWLANKVVNLRVFEDLEGRMNRSVKDVDGGVLLISQFTLYGTLKKGTRPSFNRAAHPDIAIPLYEQFKLRLGECLGKPVSSGIFGAMMDIQAFNDGPVTLVLDTRQRDF